MKKVVLLGILLLASLNASPVAASSPYISSVTGQINGTNSANATATYQFTITLTGTVPSGAFFKLGLASGNSTSNSNVNLGVGTIDSGNSTAGIAKAASQAGLMSSDFGLEATQSLSAGTYTITIVNAVNNDASCVYPFATHLFVTTDADIANYTYATDPTSVGGGCGEDSNGSGNNAIDLPLNITTFGNVVNVSWDAVTGADTYYLLADTSTDNLNARIQQVGQSGDLSGTDAMTSEASFQLSGLTANTTYYFTVLAKNSEQFLAYTQTESQTTTEGLIVDTKLAKPAFTDKERTKTQLQARWNTPELLPTSYKIEVYNKKGTKVKTVNAIDSTLTKKLIKKLTAGTAYQFRIRAEFETIDLTTGESATVTSHWSKYSDLKKTKPAVQL